MKEVEDNRGYGDGREEILLALYKDVFPVVAKFISKRGGDLEQAKDIFQDALVLWYEKSNSSNAVKSDKFYLFGISKHLWFRRFGEQVRWSGLDELSDIDVVELEEDRPAGSKIVSLLQQSGQKCLELLTSFYYDKFSMSEIAKSFGFQSERSATVQKYKCLEKVRETVKEKALEYEDFVE